MFRKQGCWVKKTLNVLMDLKEGAPLCESI